MNLHDPYDVIIIGAGGVGCAIARELSRYQLRIAVLEKECDVAAGTSGRNSAVVHAGFNNKFGSLMSQLCVAGNAGFADLCQELDVLYKKTGKLLVAFDDEDLDILDGLVEKGKLNGCTGLHIIGQEELREKAPHVGGIAAMSSPETAIFNPFIYTIALAENAAANGVDFYFNHEVIGIQKQDGLFQVRTASGDFSSRFLVNSAGLYSDRISAMAGVPGYQIYPCRGEYFILDKIADKLLDVPLYPAPKPYIGGLGVHLTPTIDGNLIIGPSAEYIDDRDDYASTEPVRDKLFLEAMQLLPAIRRNQIIGSYCGIRPKLAPPNEGGFRDFVIQEEKACPGLINLVGIESPGLTASMPIARMVRDILRESCELVPDPTFNPIRKGITRFKDQPLAEQKRMVEQNPDYGEIICRCQQVTKQEIREAIENPLGVCSISSIKYRAWATTGRCQGGYCLTRITEILEKEYGYTPEQITQRGSGSELYIGRVK